MGAVNCRKIAFAAVVILVAKTNRIKIPEKNTAVRLDVKLCSSFIFFVLSKDTTRTVTDAIPDL